MICDLAETYHIFNYKDLHPETVAVLVLGLRDNSRVKMKLADTRLTLDQMLLAMIVDNLNFLSWTKTKSAQKGKYNQKSLFKRLMGEDKENKDDLISFATPEEYEEYMKQFEK